MIPRPRLLFASLVLFFIVISARQNVAAQAVTTYHNDPARTGANLNETVLTPANVNSTQFGKLGSYPVDGQVYGQPLYIPNLTINGGQHNVVFAVTEHNSVYAFDADLKASSPLWMVNLGPSVPSGDGLGISPEVGITSTPVIDPATNAIYVLAITRENGGNVYRLHALDILSGNERTNSPQVVDASFPGSGTDSVNGTIAMEHDCYQRAGLALTNGRVYLAFAHCKHGWILAYDKTSLQQTAVLNTTPNGEGGTIWMGGGAPAVDASGNVYVMTGTNIGSFGLQYNNSFLKLGADLSVGDYFYPANNQTLIDNDADLGAGAPILMPDNSSGTPHEVIGGGKDGRIYVINRDNMGTFNESQLVQPPIQTGTSQYNNIHSTPAYWNGRLYIHSNGDVVRAYNWTNGMLSTSSVDAGTLVYRAHGATVSISANGNTNGILWDLDATNQPNGPVVLHAYDPGNLSHELYNSSQAGTRDTAGPAVKFTVPTVTNGKVYLGTGTELDVFGLLNSGTAPTVQLSANPSTITAGQSSTLTWSSTNATSVTISGVGTFGPSGTTTVTPSSTTTYTATAAGSGGSATASATVTVQSSQGCTPAPNSVTVCSPTAGSTVSSPVSFVAAANADSGIDAMAIYVDNQLAYGPANGSTINTSLNIAPGSHNVTVQAWVTAATETVIKNSFTITVTSSTAPTVQLSANPSTINAGQSSTLTWSSTNATSVTISGVGTFGPSGTTTVTPSSTTTYTATATGSGGSATASATVTVQSGTAPTVQLSANPSTITAGQSSTLTWSSTNATSVAISGVGTFGPSGTTTVTPSSTTTYTATATGSGGSATASATVTVQSSTAPTVQLSANPSTITAGQSSTLSWSSTNATSVTISGVGTFGPSGTTTVTPSSTTTYTATATGSGGSATASATVTVQSSQGCTPAPNSVTVCSPTAGSTVSSPVSFVAAANADSGIDAMAIYVDDQLAYGPVNGSSINTSLNMTSGSHNITVQAWVTAATETVIKNSFTITVN